jgi:hypothetical protein
LAIGFKVQISIFFFILSYFLMLKPLKSQFVFLYLCDLRVVGLELGALSLVRIIGELLERKAAAPV